MVEGTTPPPRTTLCLIDLDVDKFKSDIVQRLGSRGYELYFKDLNTFMKCYKYREEVK